MLIICMQEQLEMRHENTNISTVTESPASIIVMLLKHNLLSYPVILVVVHGDSFGMNTIKINHM